MTLAIVDAVRLLLFPALMAFAAASDLFTMTISNRVSLALVAGFAVMAFAIGMSGPQVLSHVGAASAVLAVTFCFFACGWIGGGDAKLASATALWLGFGFLADYLFTAALVGGILTLAIMLLRSCPLPSVLGRQDWAMRLHSAKSGIPYGIALAAAALIVYPHTFWMNGAAH